MENSDAYTAVSHGFPFFFFFSELDNKYFFPSVFSPVVKKKMIFIGFMGGLVIHQPFRATTTSKHCIYKL